MVEDTNAIAEVMVDLGNFLFAKNDQYGSSVMRPVQIFAKGLPPDTLIRARLDDKLSRLARGNASIESDEDIFRDIAGYCILWLAQRKVNNELRQ